MSLLNQRKKNLNFIVVKEFACPTSAERMGRKTVRVAGLEANSVTADTSRQASRVTAQGGRPLMGSSCLPIHTDRPDTCTHTHKHITCEPP